MDFRTPLAPDQLYHRCDTSRFTFETTDELQDLSEPIGQERAIRAIEFGVGIRREGYNLFVLGPSGAGKYSLLRDVLAKHGQANSTPSDWCYVHNFDDPLRPIAIPLKAGEGAALRQDLKEFTENITHAIRAAFDSESYLSQEKEIQQNFRKIEEQAFLDLEKVANGHSIAFLRTETGFVFGPIRNGKILGPEEFQKLNEKERQDIEETIQYLQDQLQKLLQDIPQWQQEMRKNMKELSAKTARLAVGHLVDTLKDKYHREPAIINHFEQIQKDIIENVDAFRYAEQPEAMMGLATGSNRATLLRHYQINLLIDHAHSKGAPVIYCANPTHDNLIGKTEYLSHMGTLVTDFMLVRPGALHQANGGYLIIDAHKILSQPYAWEALKRCLSERQITIESLAHSLGFISTVTLEPEPIALDTKVVLMGERMVYYLLAEYDPDFSKLFKVAADFEVEIHRNDDSTQAFARMIATHARKEKLRPFSRHAVARTIEQSARMIEHAHKLSVHMGQFVDLLREADYWAQRSNHQVVEAEDVQKAIDEQRYRLDRAEKHVQEQILEGSTLIDTAGAKVGQINGLSVLTLGHFMFGQPSRITATARPGDGKLVDIEHEAELGGEIHTKAMLILSHFLSARYATKKQFSVAASIGFEQSYGGIEGDSASVAELCALISSISGIPIKQNLAVTGSINQQGQVQVIGGLNEKIEGFFDICAARGLTGDQGVVIPANNIKHLMLKQEILDAAAKGQFHIYGVNHVDEALSLLMGMDAGERDAEGNFPENTINHKVEQNLLAMADIVHHNDNDNHHADEETEEESDEDEGDAGEHHE